MLKLKNNLYSEEYYANSMTFMDILKPTRFMQFQGNHPLCTFMNTINYYTKQIDLTPPNDEIKTGFSKSVKYHINKSKKAGVTFHTYPLDSDEAIKFYVDYFNEFSKSKNLHFTISEKEIKQFLDIESFIVTYAQYNDQILVMHGYTVDKELKIVNLRHSASHFRFLDDDTIDRNFVGMANRFLHYEDMLYFKEEGHKIYDLGGYQVEETEDQGLLQINTFKDGFRGELVQQNHYESYTFSLLKVVYRLLKK